MAAGTIGERGADVDWLRRRWPAGAAQDPSRAWSAGGTVVVPVGLYWDVIEAPLHPSLEALSRVRGQGPLLVCARERSAWWPVALGASAEWPARTGFTVLSAGTGLRVPAEGRYADGLSWLKAPDGTGRLTATRDLHRAFDGLRAVPGG